MYTGHTRRGRPKNICGCVLDIVFPLELQQRLVRIAQGEYVAPAGVVGLDPSGTPRQAGAAGRGCGENQHHEGHWIAHRD